MDGVSFCCLAPMNPTVNFDNLFHWLWTKSKDPCQYGSIVENCPHFKYSLYSVVYGIGVTLIQPLEYSEFFNREKVYGYSDDFERSVESIFNHISLSMRLTSGFL